MTGCSSTNNTRFNHSEQTEPAEVKHERKRFANLSIMLSDPCVHNLSPSVAITSTSILPDFIVVKIRYITLLFFLMFWFNMSLFAKIWVSHQLKTQGKQGSRRKMSEFSFNVAYSSNKKNVYFLSLLLCRTNSYKFHGETGKSLLSFVCSIFRSLWFSAILRTKHKIGSLHVPSCGSNFVIHAEKI